MVSVIVPCYNAEKYLKRAVDSLLNQTYKDIEIILINDGSVDKTQFLIEEYAEKDNRIKVVNKPNGGPSSARNKGINVAKGEYIAFVDSDDYVEPTYIESLVLNLEQTNSDLLSQGYLSLYENGEIFDRHLPKNKIYCLDIEDDYYNVFTAFLTYQIHYNLWAKLFKKNIKLC